MIGKQATFGQICEFLGIPRISPRVRRRIFGNSSGNFKSAIKYIYDGWNVIQERDYGDTPTVSYTRGSDPQGAGGWTSQVLQVRCPRRDVRFRESEWRSARAFSAISSGSWTAHHAYRERALITRRREADSISSNEIHRINRSISSAVMIISPDRSSKLLEFSRQRFRLGWI